MSDSRISKFESYEGRFRRVVHSEGALESWLDARGRVPSKEADITEGFLERFYEIFADSKRMPVERATPEGLLPDGKRFFALKRGDIRVYYWYSASSPNTLVVSHYVKKSWTRLRKQDTRKVHANWKKHEAET